MVKYLKKKKKIYNLLLLYYKGGVFIYLLSGFFSFAIIFILTKIVYKNSRYLEKKYNIDLAEIESIKNINLYYSLKKGFFEIFMWMLPVICILLFILLEMDNYMTEKEISEMITFYFSILLFFMVVSLLRTLFILNYKLTIKDNVLHFKSLFDSFSIDLKEVKLVDLLGFHIYIETYNRKRFFLIPLGFNNIHIIYRLLIDNCEFNRIYNSFNSNSNNSNVIYRSKDEYITKANDIN